jgi:hypothetical protein
MDHPLLRVQHKFQPFGVDVSEYREAAQALGGRGIGIFQLAAKPQPIDDEQLDEFCKRWAELLAKAYSGELSHPRSLPFS